MKTKSIILTIVCLAMMIFAVGCDDQGTSSVASGSQTTFNGIVTEMNDSSITVQPYKGQPEADKAEKIIVSTEIDSSKKSSALEPGKSVLITYDGNISGGSPAKIDGVYEINLVDVKGNIIENN